MARRGKFRGLKIALGHVLCRRVCEKGGHVLCCCVWMTRTRRGWKVKCLEVKIMVGEVGMELLCEMLVPGLPSPLTSGN